VVAVQGADLAAHARATAGKGGAQSPSHVYVCEKGLSRLPATAPSVFAQQTQTRPSSRHWPR
jgi:hypothetical protein